jgi:hypothetical protein
MPIGIGLLDEPLHPITIPGVLLILGGAVLAQRPARNGSPPSPPSSVLTRTEVPAAARSEHPRPVSGNR